MPLYEYVCDECGKVSEALRRMSQADAAIPCEHCGSDRTQRAQSVFAAATGRPARPDVPQCGRCGNPDGACKT